MSPVMQKGFILFLSRMSKIAGCKGGPTSRQSFNDGACGFCFAEQSYTILILVDSASSLITA